ncbi:MAG TPA: PBP1A family penicillin-binding protein [Caulobacteraceae bacterium]|jgi:1A family penicillin-binding protein
MRDMIDLDPAAPTPQPAPPAAPPPGTPDDRPFWKRKPRLTAIAVGAWVGVLILAWLSWALPLGRALEPLPSPTLVLVTADGKPFARRGSYKEEPVDASELPPRVSQAFIAIEDKRFYRHAGLDLRGIARAMRTNMEAGELEQGGSTITQQLAKNAFLSNERTLRRKAQEAVIALYLEAALSKEEILSRYLSAVYFGDGVFGLRAAARHFFDKAPEDLTLGEASLLAGTVKAPSRLNPIDDMAAAKRRQRLVLTAMVEEGFITEAEARRARNVRVREGRDDLPVGSYFADWVSPEAKEEFERAYGEVVVRTTLDSRMQANAERIVRRTLAGPGRRANATQAALVAMRTDGSVVAMVGGADYRRSKYNRATQAVRQPGSAFKLFVYLTALREGMSANSPVLDAPITIGDWSPENYEGEYAGRPVTLREAFARSSNVASVRLAQQVGVRDIIATARDLGVSSPLPNDPTIALGTGGVSLMELTSAYAAVAGGVTPVRARGLADAPERRQRTRELSARERRDMMELLRAVVTSGTGTAANFNIPAYGKTGTTQDYRDAWFVGFAGDLVIGVWVGNDNNAPMRNVTGGSLPAQIWREFASASARNVEIGGDLPELVAPELQTGDPVPADWLDQQYGPESDPFVGDPSLPPLEPQPGQPGVPPAGPRVEIPPEARPRFEPAPGDEPLEEEPPEDEEPPPPPPSGF